MKFEILNFLLLLGFLNQLTLFAHGLPQLPPSGNLPPLNGTPPAGSPPAGSLPPSGTPPAGSLPPQTSNQSTQSAVPVVTGANAQAIGNALVSLAGPPAATAAVNAAPNSSVTLAPIRFPSSGPG
jgi:hypothetical protein